MSIPTQIYANTDGRWHDKRMPPRPDAELYISYSEYADLQGQYIRKVREFLAADTRRIRAEVELKRLKGETK